MSCQEAANLAGFGPRSSPSAATQPALLSEDSGSIAKLKKFIRYRPLKSIKSAQNPLLATANTHFAGNDKPFRQTPITPPIESDAQRQ